MNCRFKEGVHCNDADFLDCNVLCKYNPEFKSEAHKRIVLELNRLYKAKNNDYGDSFAEARRRYPNAIMIRLWDKILRLETLLKGTEQKVNDESIDDTLRDLANYALMELVEREIERVGK